MEVVNLSNLIFMIILLHFLSSSIINSIKKIYLKLSDGTKLNRQVMKETKKSIKKIKYEYFNVLKVGGRC